MLLLQPLNKIDTKIDPVGLEIDKIEAAASGVGGFAREVYEFSEGAADLFITIIVSIVLSAQSACLEKEENERRERTSTAT